MVSLNPTGQESVEEQGVYDERILVESFHLHDDKILEDANSVSILDGQVGI